MTSSWPRRLGLAIDRALNVVLWDGLDTETVSLHAAEEQAAGDRAGCVVCAILGILIERGHCTKTLDPNAVESAGAAIRAGLIMASGIAAAIVALHALISFFA